MPKANYFRVLRPLLEPSGIAADDRLFAQNDARSRPDSNINHYSFVLGSAGKHVQSASINVFYSTPPPPFRYKKKLLGGSSTWNWFEMVEVLVKEECIKIKMG